MLVHFIADDKMELSFVTYQFLHICIQVSKATTQGLCGELMMIALSCNSHPYCIPS
jgi:hypothetical protein